MSAPNLSSSGNCTASRWAGIALAVGVAGACASAPTATGAAPAAEVAVVWSADGSTVGGLGARRTIHAFDGTSGRELWSVRAGRALFPGLGRDAAIDRLQLLPEGHGALFAAAGDLFLWRADSRRGRRLTSTPEPELDAEVAPNGDTVAFVREDDLWTLDLITGEESRLTAHRELAGLAGRPPALRRIAWAPESRTLAFSAAAPEGGVLVVDLPSQTLRRLETGGAASGRVVSFSWRPDARGIGVERLAADNSRLDLLLCHPEKLYCKELATRAVSDGGTARNDFRFLADGFLWGDGGGLGRYDTVGRETGTLMPPEWHLEQILAVDGDQTWAITTAITTDGSRRAATMALRITGARAMTFLAPDRALDSRLFSPSRTFWVRYESRGQAEAAILASLEGGKIADLPGLVAPAGSY